MTKTTFEQFEEELNKCGYEPKGGSQGPEQEEFYSKSFQPYYFDAFFIKVRPQKVMSSGIYV